jgi:phenylacetate-CoA ligase
MMRVVMVPDYTNTSDESKRDRVEGWGVSGSVAARQVYNPAIENLDASEVRALQWTLLRRQLERLWHHNPFYRRRLEGAGATPERITSMEAFRELVPMCTKRDLLADQTEHPQFGLRLGVPESEVVQVWLTSGTSGVGQEVYGHTWRDAIAGGTALVEGAFFPAGWRPGDRIYSMTPISTLAFGLCAIEAFRVAGYQPFQVFNYDSAAKLRLMERFGVHGIVITPAHLARITTICQDEGIDPKTAYPELKSIVVAGQSYPVEVIEGVQEAWGVKVHDLYGSTQGNGAIAGNCELGALHDGRRTGMHLLEHRNLLEIIDPDTGQPVGPGEEGMGVITNLSIEGSPLLRFRTDDKMRYLGEETCRCGRTTRLIEAGTLSRYDDMMKIRGMNIWPQAVDDVMFAEPAVDEYVGRVYVDEGDLEQVEIRYATKPGLPLSPEERTGLRERLVHMLKIRLNVTCRLVDVPRSDLPVFEFKAVRWTDTRQTDLQKKVW